MTRPWRILRALLLCRPAPRPDPDEWRLIRQIVISRDGGRCQFRALWGWGPTCGRPVEEVDHDVPCWWGGSSEPANCRSSCRAHNRDKGARPPLGWLLRRIARQTALYAALGYLAVMAWSALPDAPPAAVAGPAGGQWAVVVAADGRTVAPFATEADARRAADAWDRGRGQLGVAAGEFP